MEKKDDMEWVHKEAVHCDRCHARKEGVIMDKPLFGDITVKVSLCETCISEMLKSFHKWS